MPRKTKNKTPQAPKNPKSTPKVRSMPSRVSKASSPSIPLAKQDGRIKSFFNVSVADNRSIVRVRGCEPVSSVVLGATFLKRLDEYIYPMNPTLFAKLSVEASLYDKFRFRNVKLLYRPSCAATVTGQVGLLILPDTETDEAPLTMIELERYEHSILTSPWATAMVMQDSSRDMSMWYFNAAPAEWSTITLGTKRQQAPGVAQLFVDQSRSADVGTVGGYLFIEYDIEFCERRSPLQTGAGLAGPLVNYAGTGTLKGFVPDLSYSSSSSNVLFGSPGSFFSGLTEEIKSATGATPSYIAALGLAGPVLMNQAIKGLPGSYFGSYLSSFQPVTNPLKDRSGLIADYVPVEKKVLPASRGAHPFHVVYRDGGWYERTDQKDVELKSHPILSPSTSGDCSSAFVVYDPVLNTTTSVPGTSHSVSSESSTQIEHVGIITIATAYSVWILYSISYDVFAGESRKIGANCAFVKRD